MDSEPSAPEVVVVRPHWNPERRELMVAQYLVKRFRRAAAIQERVLSAFQEENWVVRVADPIPPTHGLDSKRRLSKAIAALNAQMLVPLMRFYGDGSGQAICWQYTNPRFRVPDPSPGVELE